VVDITALGGYTVLTLITVLTAGYLLASRKVGTAVYMLIAIAGGAALSDMLKYEVARPRPEIVAHLVDVHSTSFPSGHAMNSAITYLTLGTLLARAEGSRAVRIYLLAVAILLTLLIGASRVYLGVHWPSDVVAGWCVGASWASVCSMVMRVLERRRAIEPASDADI
jgi:undecaprenyl-diphosphatase